MREAGYVERDPDTYKREFTMRSDDYDLALIEVLVILEIITMISLILSPHPTEDTQGWKFLMEYQMLKLFMIHKQMVNSSLLFYTVDVLQHSKQLFLKNPNHL